MSSCANPILSTQLALPSASAFREARSFLINEGVVPSCNSNQVLTRIVLSSVPSYSFSLLSWLWQSTSRSIIWTELTTQQAIKRILKCFPVLKCFGRCWVCFVIRLRTCKFYLRTPSWKSAYKSFFVSLMLTVWVAHHTSLLFQTEK